MQEHPREMLRSLKATQPAEEDIRKQYLQACLDFLDKSSNQLEAESSTLLLYLRCMRILCAGTHGQETSSLVATSLATTVERVARRSMESDQPTPEQVAALLTTAAQALSNLSVVSTAAAVAFPIIVPDTITTVAHFHVPAAHEAALQFVHNCCMHDASLGQLLCKRAPHFLALSLRSCLESDTSAPIATVNMTPAMPTQPPSSTPLGSTACMLFSLLCLRHPLLSSTFHAIQAVHGGPDAVVNETEEATSRRLPPLCDLPEATCLLHLLSHDINSSCPAALPSPKIGAQQTVHCTLSTLVATLEASYDRHVYVHAVNARATEGPSAEPTKGGKRRQVSGGEHDATACQASATLQESPQMGNAWAIGDERLQSGDTPVATTTPPDDAQGSGHFTEALVEVLTSILCKDEQTVEGVDVGGALALEHGLATLAARMMARLEPTRQTKAQPPPTTASSSLPESTLQEGFVCAPYEGFRSDILALIGNLAHERREVQDAFLEAGVIELVLSQCFFDPDSPLVREWALWAIRNLCAGNSDVQERIREVTQDATVVREASTHGPRSVAVDGLTGKLKFVDVSK